MEDEIRGEYTEPDILKFKKEEVMRVILGMPNQQAKLMLVGSDGVYFMCDSTTSTDRLNNVSVFGQAFAEGCNPSVDKFDDWWELKRATWGGDDGADNVDAIEILTILHQCRTHLIVAFKEDSFEVMPDTIGE